MVGFAVLIRVSNRKTCGVTGVLLRTNLKLIKTAGEARLVGRRLDGKIDIFVVDDGIQGELNTAHYTLGIILGRDILCGKASDPEERQSGREERTKWCGTHDCRFMSKPRGNQDSGVGLQRTRVR